MSHIQFPLPFYYQIPTIWPYHSAGTEWQLRISIGITVSPLLLYSVYNKALRPLAIEQGFYF